MDNVKKIANTTKDKVAKFRFEHLERTGYTYFTHFKRAGYIGGSMILAGSKTMIHALWPDVFEHSATDQVAILQKELSKELEQKKGSQKKKE
jgi:hypothetical protein